MRIMPVRSALLSVSMVVLLGCELDFPSGAGGATDPYELSKRVRITAIEMGAEVENIMFSSTGRLYVSVNRGLYEVVRAADGELKAIARSAVTDCQFAGLAEHEGVLFANCTDMGSHSWLYAAYETEEPVFERLSDLAGVSCSNGLAVDDRGDLYVASQLQSAIVRVRVDYAGPVSVVSSETWKTLTFGTTPNGLKIREGSLYWSGLSDLTVEDLDSPSSRSRLFSALTVVDDFHVDAKGILLTDFLGGAIYSLDRSGKQVGKTSAGVLKSPSMVLPALGRLGFSQDDLLVAERGGGTGNRISVLRK